MAEHPWCVRIGEGADQGSGFLISARLVLTCRHVADHFADRQHRTLTVWFGYLQRQFDAKILFESESGDVAVLELAEEPPVKPATFAPLSILDVRIGAAARMLSAIGYPRQYTQTGRTADFYAQENVGTPGGTVPVKGDLNDSNPLEGGYSGAAVILMSGAVVGMVVQADRARDGTGLILPLNSILHWWPGLDEHLQLGELFNAQAYRRLRAILGPLDTTPRQVQTAMEGLFQTFTNLPKVEGQQFRVLSVMAAIEYLGTEMSRPVGFIRTVLFHLLSELQRELPPDSRELLAGWMREFLMGEGPPPESGIVDFAEPIRSGSMMVRIARSARGAGSGYDVTVFRVDPDGAVLDAVESVAVSRELVQDEVEAALLDLFQPLEHEDYESYFLEFAVPPSWHDVPVESWRALYQDEFPLGQVNPVMIRDLQHFDTGRPVLDHKWTKLSNMTTADVDWRDCTDLVDVRMFQLWLRRHKPVLVGLAGMPAAAFLEKAVAGGVPAMLWTRAVCGVHRGGGTVGACGGLDFRRTVTTLLNLRKAEEIPVAVYDLRMAAGAGEDLSGWGNSVALMWNDPRRLPQGTRMGMPEAVDQ